MKNRTNNTIYTIWLAAMLTVCFFLTNTSPAQAGDTALSKMLNTSGIRVKMLQLPVKGFSNALYIQARQQAPLLIGTEPDSDGLVNLYDLGSGTLAQVSPDGQFVSQSDEEFDIVKALCIFDAVLTMLDGFSTCGADNYLCDITVLFTLVTDIVTCLESS